MSDGTVGTATERPSLPDASQGAPDSPSDGPARTLLSRGWAYELGYAVLVVGAAALILSVVGRSAGWPIGSSFNVQFILVQLYAAHFRHLDFFPVWSTTDGLGLGTPILLFYHKAFFYVSGLLLILLGGNLKATLIITIGIFLAVGAYGMRCALQLVTDSRLLQVIGSIGFLFTNYVFTDWLIRGDLPEFSAMMIVPWLLYWCLNLVKNRRVSWSLIVIVPLLVDGHSAIGLLSIFTLAVTMVVFVLRYKSAGLRAAVPRLLGVTAGAVVLLAPTLLAELRFTKYYDPAVKVTHYDEVRNDYRPFGSYFYDGTFHWLGNNAHDLVQIDYAIWIPIALGLVAACMYWALSRTRLDRTSWGRRLDLPCILLLLGCLGVYLILQLRSFYWFYELFTPLQAIDFPSRMLAFITPIGIILLVALVNGALSSPTGRWASTILSLGWLCSLVLLSPLTSTWTVDYGALAPPGKFPPLSYSAPPQRVNYATFHGLFTFNGLLFQEYLPSLYQSDGKEVFDDTPLYTQLHRVQDGAASVSGAPCSVAVPTDSPLESLSLTFTVRCTGKAQVALPVTFNPSSSVYLQGSGGALHQIPYTHNPSDPRMIVRIPGSKPEVVVVHLPTLWGILK